MAAEFIFPVQKIIADHTKSAEEKIEKIKEAEVKYKEVISEMNIRDYGVDIP